MLVTFKNKMIVTFGPWLKGRVLGQHTCPYGLRSRSPLRFASRRRLRRTTTTTTETKQALRALAQGEGAWSAHLPLRTASEITTTTATSTTITVIVSQYLAVHPDDYDDDERRSLRRCLVTLITNLTPLAVTLITVQAVRLSVSPIMSNGLSDSSVDS